MGIPNAKSKDKTKKNLQLFPRKQRKKKAISVVVRKEENTGIIRKCNG